MSARYISGNTSAEMRNTYIQESFGPIAKILFKDDIRAQSLILAVGQYWADEAEDAVHIDLVPCVVTKPKWPECLNDNPFIRDEFIDWKVFDSYEVGKKFPQLDANTNAITAFASCCHEITSQEDPIADTSRPYAIARRSDHAPGYTIEIVGSVLRPDWEDITDLVEESDRRALIDSAYEATTRTEPSMSVMPPPTPTETAAAPPTRQHTPPTKKRGLLDRLLGRGLGK